MIIHPGWIDCRSGCCIQLQVFGKKIADPVDCAGGDKKGLELSSYYPGNATLAEANSKTLYMYDVLASGKESFKIEVPYKLIETGKKGVHKPLMVYLHGYNQNIKQFEEKITDFFQLEAYHLLIQGPYPIYDTGGNRKVSEWGRAWYLYDGNRGQFIKSLEVSAEFIQQVLDRHLQLIKVSRICIFGYSMGGYLAGYFALTRWKHIHDLIVAGSRIKTEVLNDEWANISHMNVLALHGERDESVKAEPQKDEIEKLQKHGVSATFKSIDEKHKLTEAFITEAKQWLTTLGYKEINKS